MTKHADNTDMPVTDAASTTPAIEPARQGEFLLALTPEHVAEAIRAAGCAVTAVTEDGIVRLHSAAHGVGFQVLWGNAAAPGLYADLTLSCPLRVQGGTLPANVQDEWHRSKRFARVAIHGDFVVLEMDVIATGGVTTGHVAVMMQLWSQMMGQFFVYLRNLDTFKNAPAAEAATID
ncbi:MAG: YbjN domain-containing protein [Rhodocyclaceae bacterium]